MIPLFSSEQVRLADKYAINNLGIPGITLMENASINIKNYILESFSQICSEDKIGIICGRGNNGGDGYAVARHLCNNGFKVTVVSLANEKDLAGDAKINYHITKNLSKVNRKLSLISFKSIKDLKVIADSSVIIDAMLGTGAKGDLREPYFSIVKKLNQLNCIRIAVDIPTGLNVDTGFGTNIFNADLTVTLAENKIGLFIGDGSTNSGIIKKGSIGIGNEYFDQQKVSTYLIEPEDAYLGIPKRNKGSQKYSAGKVFTIAGSEKYPGAACLTANASLNIGAGASILAFPDSIKGIAQTKLNSAVVKSYTDDSIGILGCNSISDIEEYLYWADVVAIGPGLGRDIETIEAVNEIIRIASKKQFVIDADAIFAISNNKYKKLNLSGQILTPHHKEFADLIGISIEELKRDLIAYGKKFVGETNAYLVLKGAPTIIFNPKGEVFINSAGNSGMSKFGVGDVLTGAIAGFTAQSKNVEEALIASVFIHSLSADLLLPQKGEYGITAEQISSNLGNTIVFLRKSFD